MNKYNISIPIIQRDYAQGRNNTDIVEIRDNFLDAIDKKLSKNENLHLDFIYGSIKKDKFIPLDGQQRLTTLYLLYFYFGKKEQQDIEYLSKFTYETRSSSREFCQKLISSDIDFANDNLSDQIKDSHWFLPYWDNDPTIKSMFIMLDSIHKKFKDYKYFNNLNNITFEFFELEKFGLDDDLYIKMNARGKPLTPFENFKANFEAILENVDKNLKNEFSNKIDKEWIDIFWKYKNNDYLIDEPFMNYFYYITEILNTKDIKIIKEPSRFELKSKLSQLYSNNKNIKFLFSAIDKLPLILKSFNDIFSTNKYQKDKVALFDDDINLAQKIIKNNPVSLEQKIILFTIIQYFIKYDNFSDNIKDIIRIIRNLLIRIRGLKQSQLYYTQSIKYENMNAILKLVDTLIIQNDIYDYLQSAEIDLKYTAITQDSLKQEVKKAKLISLNNDFRELIFKLEDFVYLKGDIHNFLIEDITIFRQYKESIIDIYTNNNDTQIIQSMLTCGNYRLWRGWAGGSSKYFFGKNKYWEIILTSDKKDFFHKFVDSYLKNDKSLQKMKDDFLNNYDKKDWKYYFIKYNKMIETNNWLSKDNNVYAWYDDHSLEKMGGSNMNAYHINPYILSLANKCNIELGWYNGYIRGDWNSSLKLIGKIKELYSLQEGWKIEFSDTLDEAIKDDLISKYNLESKYNNIFIFRIQDDKDKITEMYNLFCNLNRITKE